ncbi:MAG: hypothetical protein ABIP89_22895, partial [Polyangiaceae bacterium]
MTNDDVQRSPSVVRTARAPAFRDLFGRLPEARGAAPICLNLLGHARESGGYTLHVVTSEQARVELAHRSDPLISAAHLGRHGPVELRQYQLGSESAGAAWVDGVQFTTRLLSRLGFNLGGFDLRVESDFDVEFFGVPTCIALMRVLRSAFQLDLNDARLALFARTALGCLEPSAASAASPAFTRSAVLIEGLTERCHAAALPRDVELTVISTGQAALPRLALPATRPPAEPFALRRRAAHLADERRRAVQAFNAIQGDDALRLGEILSESHDSLRILEYTESAELDTLVDLARRDLDVYGARMLEGLPW